MKTYIENNLEKLLVGAAVLTVILWSIAAIALYPIDKQIEIEKEKLAQMK
jgi:hypothetical protein